MAPEPDRPKPAIVVVVPTFNERDNIPALARRVFEVAAREGWELELLAVDDDSPDGTAQVVRAEARRLGKPLRVLERRAPRRDLSRSVLEGIRTSEQQTIVVMDADLSHRPEDIPLLVKPLLEERASFVVGSRYLEGSENALGLLRRIHSRIPALLARPLTRLTDPLSGFFALKRSLLAGDLELAPTGFKIGLELLVRTGTRSVLEVPIRFERRRGGTSKLSLREELRFLGHLGHLYVAAAGRRLGRRRRGRS